MTTVHFPMRLKNWMCHVCFFAFSSKEKSTILYNCLLVSFILLACFTGHAKVIISLLQDVQENDQRLTVLQLVDKIKIKHKELGMFIASLYNSFCIR